MKNVFEQTEKTVQLTRQNLSGENDTLALGCRNRGREISPEFASDTLISSGARRIVDIGKVEQTWQLNCMVSDEYVAHAQDEGTMDTTITLKSLQVGGDTVDITTKEDVERVLEDFLYSNSDVRPHPYILVYGGVTKFGFLGSVSVDEASQNGMSTLDISLEFLVADAV